MQLPGRNVLILGAICLSIIGGVVSYQIADNIRNRSIHKNAGIVASINTTNPTTKIQALLAQTQAEQIATTTVSPFTPLPGDTLTERLSKNFFSSYAQAQVSNSGNSADDAALANNALASVDTSKMPKQKYSIANMQVVANGTTADLKAYGNLFASIQINGFKPVKDHPELYNTNLAKLAAVYGAIGEQLKNMQVPIAVSNQHLEIVNDYILAKDLFPMIDQQSKDPLKALLAVRMFKDSDGRQEEMYTEIASYFSSNGILFDDTEPGSFWSTFQQ